MAPNKNSFFAEREEQLKLFASRIAKAQDDHQDSVIVIMGETGIGKTRLVAEFSDLAAAQGFNVLIGRSYSAGSDVAYSPVVEMFNQSFRELDTHQITAWTEDLPDLGKLFRRLPVTEFPRIGDPVLEKTRLFESMVCLIERMADGRPILLIQEDLHFAARQPSPTRRPTRRATPAPAGRSPSALIRRPPRRP